VNELHIHSILVLTIIVVAAPTFVTLLWVTAPYGRHVRAGWGTAMPARTGWIVMESPAVFVFALVYGLGDNAAASVPLVFLFIWQFHYLNRTFIFPIRMRESGRKMPVAIVGMGIVFNCINAYVNARWISHFGEYQESWMTTAPFALGVLCFLVGWAINQHADTTLIRLRKPGDTGYEIPRGGMYRWISCPNYLGEMLEWIGWAIASWSLAGTAFAVFTIANLLPRAIANHRWYKQAFPDYPPARRAIIPGLL
jgi:3-oxo-5-alpha-steroid 4-dehydrogenase 1